MKYKTIITLCSISIGMTFPALAQEAMSIIATETSTQQVDPIMAGVAELQKGWAEAKYQGAGKASQLDALGNLEKQASDLVAANPGRAEPMIWKAIILSTEAGITKGVSALPKVKEAKKLLEASIQLDPRALDGSAYTSLGSLYYQVPGWPIGFGDMDKAEQQLKTALAINPEGIDPNYFYGDFLIKKKKYDEALIVLQKALAAPDRPGRNLADEGRRQEIRAAIDTVQAELKNKKSSEYN